MASQNFAPENFDSTAQLMLEALDKAAVELSKIVAECVEMVAMSGLAVQRTLMLQLRSMSEKYQSSVDGESDGMDKKKEQLLVELQKFEEEQIEAIESTAKIVCAALIEHTNTVIGKIAAQLNEKALKTVGTQKDPSVLLKDCYEMAKPAIDKTLNTGQQKLEQIFNSCDSELESKTHDCINQLTDKSGSWNESMSKRLQEVLSGFQQRAGSVMDKLHLLVTQSLSEVDENHRNVLSGAESELTKSLTAMDKACKGWSSGLSDTYDDLNNDLSQKHEQARQHTAGLLSENLDELNSYLTNLAGDHAEKVYESHRTYLASLNKLEGACVQRLEHLHEYFSSLFASSGQQTAEFAVVDEQSRLDHRDRLRANLKAHSGQVMDAASALIAQLESDFSRSSDLLNERIENIKREAVDYLKDQVRNAEAEADKSAKEFQRDLRKLEGSLKEIGDAGQAAAVTVTAYLGTVLSLDE